jgi:hypothetical protein
MRLLAQCNLLAPLARIALCNRCLPLSLADEKRVCSLVRSGQRRDAGRARFPMLAAVLVHHEDAISHSGCTEGQGASPLV